MPLSINALKDRVTQLEGRVYFGNAQRVGEKMRRLIEDATPKVVVLDCSALTDLEYTALTMLTDADERLRRDGVTLWLAALNPDVRHVVEHTPLGEVLGRERMLFNLESAMARYQQWECRATRHPE